MSAQTFVVTRADKGRTVAAVLRDHLPLSWSGVRRLVEGRRVRLGGVPCLDPARRVSPGQRVEVLDDPAGRSSKAPRRGKGRRNEPKEPTLGKSPDVKGKGKRPETQMPAPVIRFADDSLVVVDKPAGLTTMRHPHEAAEFGPRARKFLPPTLADLLPDLLAGGGKRPPVVAVHRLDRDTSGLVVFALTPEAKERLEEQFRAHRVHRRYLAIVRGQARPGRIESFLVDDRGDGRRGSTTQPGTGKRAVTHVRVLEDLGDYTVVECRLETGRTHQVRIHLGESGTPLCGERVYDRPPHGKPLPDASGSPRPALHAAALGFVHPATGQPMSWESPWPADLAALLGRLRKRAGRGSAPADSPNPSAGG